MARRYDAGVRFDTHLKINPPFPTDAAHLLVTRDVMGVGSSRADKERRQRSRLFRRLRGGVIYAPHTGMPSSVDVTKFQSPA